MWRHKYFCKSNKHFTEILDIFQTLDRFVCSEVTSTAVMIPAWFVLVTNAQPPGSMARSLRCSAKMLFVTFFSQADALNFKWETNETKRRRGERIKGPSGVKGSSIVQQLLCLLSPDAYHEVDRASSRAAHGALSFWPRCFIKLCMY